MFLSVRMSIAPLELRMSGPTEYNSGVVFPGKRTAFILQPSRTCETERGCARP